MEDQARYTVKVAKKLHFEDVMICYECKGTGATRVFSDNPSYEGPWTEPCAVCKGSGRLWRQIKVEFFPFK